MKHTGVHGFYLHCILKCDLLVVRVSKLNFTDLTVGNQPIGNVAGSSFECLPIVRQESSRKASPRSKPFQTTYEGIGGFVADNVQMNSSGDQASEYEDPYLSVAIRVGAAADKQRASEINSCIAECWVFFDPEFR